MMVGAPLKSNAELKPGHKYRVYISLWDFQVFNFRTATAREIEGQLRLSLDDMDYSVDVDQVAVAFEVK